MIFNLNEIDDVAQKVLNQVTSKTLLFYGNMGVGKTTLISALVKALGGKTEVSSPTFSIVNEYEVEDGIVYHFDFYRIKDIYEALDIGIEDYFDSGEWIFIEWPEKIDELLPNNYVELVLKQDKNNSRALDLECVSKNLKKI